MKYLVLLILFGSRMALAEEASNSNSALATRVEYATESSFNIKFNSIPAAAGLVNFDLEIPLTDHLTISPTLAQYKLNSSGGYSWGSVNNTWHSELEARTYGIKLNYHFRIWDRSGSCVSVAHRWFPGHVTGESSGKSVRGDFNARIYSAGYYFQWRRPSGLNFGFGGGLEYLVGFPENITSHGEELPVPRGLLGINPYVEVSVGWII